MLCAILRRLLRPRALRRYACLFDTRENDYYDVVAYSKAAHMVQV